MAPKSDIPEGHGKLLEAWEAPDGAGDPIGCLATTFTFAPAFFEEECLARFLNLETDAAEDGPLYLIEREEKLSQLVCAAVIADQHHCRGTRNLRWDLHAARPAQGILHAKVSLLCWSKQVRVIVASANLTEDGYRRNREVFGVLDFLDGGGVPLSLLHEIVRFLRACLDLSGQGNLNPSTQRASALLDRVDAVVGSWGVSDESHGREPVRVLPILTGPGRKDLFAQLADVWPQSSPPALAWVVSPFFDPPEATRNGPAEAIWGMLRKRDETSVTYCVETEEAQDSKKIVLRAPQSLMTARPKRESCSVIMRELQPDTERPLHAKELWFENDRWAALVIGSSNFTSPGTGVGRVSHYEANLVYLLDRERGARGAYPNLERRFIVSEELSKPEEAWQFMSASPDDADSPSDVPVLPAGFLSATYRMPAVGQARVELLLGGNLPAEWIVQNENEQEIASAARVAGENLSRPIHVPWTGRPPSGLWVTWTGAKGKAWWPVNISSSSDLPPPDELKDLPLEVLIDILTSARPLHEAMRTYLRRQERAKHAGGTDAGIDFDPHKRVDTSAFLLQRTRRYSWALAGLRSRLERPVPTEECLEWRLHGPVGVQAVATALGREANSDTERAFLVAELALELCRVQPQTAPGALSALRVKRSLRELARKLHAELGARDVGRPGHLDRYLASIAKEIGVG